MKTIFASLISLVLGIATLNAQTVRATDSLWFSTNGATGEPKLTSLSVDPGNPVELYAWLKVTAGASYDVGSFYLPLSYSAPGESKLQIGSAGAGQWSGNSGGSLSLPPDSSYEIFAPFDSWTSRAVYDSSYAGIGDSSDLLLGFAQNVSGGSGWNGRAPVAKFRLTAVDSGAYILAPINHPLSNGARGGLLVANPTGSNSWTPVTVPLLVSAGITTVGIAIAENWNMLSLPVTVDDRKKSTLFPSAVTSAFAYQGSYVTKDTLSYGNGYWLKFAGAGQAALTGVIREEDSVDVAGQWNMIGSISFPVRISAIGSDPPGLVVSNFFTYSPAGVYVISDTIKPGRAYWVKSGQPGKLILSSASNIPAENLVRIVPQGELPPSPPGVRPGEAKNIPAEYMLHQNYPNPFNPWTTIQFDVPAGSSVTINVYNILGQEVSTLVKNKHFEAGQYEETYDASALASGVYYYEILAAGQDASSATYRSVRKMVILR
jgi:hypothetical protein